MAGSKGQPGGRYTSQPRGVATGVNTSPFPKSGGRSGGKPSKSGTARGVASPTGVLRRSPAKLGAYRSDAVGTSKPKLKYGKPVVKAYSSKISGRRQAGQQMPGTDKKGSSGLRGVRQSGPTPSTIRGMYF